ncbi:MAG: CPBP family intramembrane metalloprotease [Bacteroidetes bacterium]|nr:CPBP family intramembrane metalloprotease [Bacteroidota bacterium]
MKYKVDNKIGLVVLWLMYQCAEAFMHFYGDVVAFLSLMAAMLYVAHLVAQAQGRSGIVSFQLNWDKKSGHYLLAGLVSGLLTYGLAFALSLVSGREILDISILSLKSILIKSSLFVLGTFLPSIAEDVLTRGYLFTILKGRISRWGIVCLSTIVFVLNHTYKLTGPVEGLLYLAILGFYLAVPVMLTGSLWYSVGLHWMGNIVYRISADVLQSKMVPGYTISSLYLLMFLVTISIPFNMLAIYNMKKKLSKRSWLRPV